MDEVQALEKPDSDQDLLGSGRSFHCDCSMHALRIIIVYLGFPTIQWN